MAEKSNVTRGNGILEGFLAQLRAKKADSLIPDQLRHGKILDIGCGTFPHFLNLTQFGKKYGLDRIFFDASGFEQDEESKIQFVQHDILSEAPLPFDDETFNVVTMLAVIEHLTPESLQKLLTDIHRVLAPGGKYIFTTPVSWTHGLLKIMARLRLVSAEEIDEHEIQYTRGQMEEIMAAAGFKGGNIETGTFELGMNIWGSCKKQG